MAAHRAEEDVKLGVGAWVGGDLKQGDEDVVQHGLEILDDPHLLVHIVQPGQLQNGEHLKAKDENFWTAKKAGD